MFGLGCRDFTIAVYIANTPAMSEYEGLTKVNSLVNGEINMIGQACGNGWRKVFNVYAKLLYALPTEYFNFALLAPSWQQYRDEHLLQENSQTALLFSPLCLAADSKTLHIICGKTYAKELIKKSKQAVQLTWLDESFAIDKQKRVIVCPYFDYRQLSNVKIERLAIMLTALNCHL